MSDPKLEIKMYSNKYAIEKGLKEIAEKAKNKKQILRETSQTVMHYISRAFDTHGESMGEKWKNWSEKYYENVRKSIGNEDILILKGTLKNSIDRQIKEDSAIIYTPLEYAAAHNFGFKGPDKLGRMLNIPKRTFMEFTDDLEEQIITTLWGELKIDEYEREYDARLKELKGE